MKDEPETSGQEGDRSHERRTGDSGADIEPLNGKRGRPTAERASEHPGSDGAYNRVLADATSFAHRAERFLLKQEAIVDATASEAERHAARGWLSYSWALVHPWGSGGVYPNFPDPELRDWDRAYHGANLDRLRRVKTTYDPENAFRFDQSIQPTTRR